MTIENVCDVLKAAIIEKLPIYLSELEDESVPLKVLDDKSVVIGDIDLDKNNRSTMCFIMPDVQGITEASIDVDEETTNLEVFFFVRKASKEVLYRQAMRYAGALQNYIHDDYSVGGEYVQASVDQIEYFDSVEASNEAIKAVSLTLSIITEGM